MYKLKNLNELGTTTLRRKALHIVEAGLQAIDTTLLVDKAIEIPSQNHIIIAGVPWRTDRKGKIYFIGVGKCATEAAVAVERALGDRLSAGIVLDVCEPYLVSNRLRFFGCTHPFPSQKNVKASLEVADFLKNVTADDLIIFVISGGGSTLLCLPESKNCDEEQMIMKRLFAVGANISEINTVRKHLSLLRGGQLARCAYPARSIALIFSDVPGNDLGFVASGPTVKDETMVKEANNILDKYEIWETCVTPGCGLMETPKDPKYFENVTNVLLMSNMLALKAMTDEALALGFHARIANDRFEGEAREVAGDIMEDLRRSPRNAALIYGGESTVTLNRQGKGGRNAELALAALRTVGKGELIVSVASDGRDNGNYAGAIADTETRQKAVDFNLDPNAYLAWHDSIKFFEQTGDYLMTGYTGSNVSDLVIAVKE